MEKVKERPIDVEAVLTDAELEAGGLAKTTAWVRTESSKGALRVKKHREKKKEEGVTQLNVIIPEEMKESMKAVAKAATETGEDPKRLIEIGTAVMSLKGLKRKIVMAILGPALR